MFDSHLSGFGRLEGCNSGGNVSGERDSLFLCLISNREVRVARKPIIGFALFHHWLHDSNGRRIIGLT